MTETAEPRAGRRGVLAFFLGTTAATTFASPEPAAAEPEPTALDGGTP